MLELRIGNLAVLAPIETGRPVRDMLLAVSEALAEREIDRVITVKGGPCKLCPDFLQIGLEGAHSENAVRCTMGGHEFWVEYDDANRNVYADPLRAMPHLLPYILSQVADSGLALVHGCAADVSGRGILIAGPGGSGRTSILLELVAAGGSYISEDFSIVARNGYLLSTGPGIHLSSEMGQDMELKDNVYPLLRSYPGAGGNVLFRLAVLRTIGMMAHHVPGRSLARFLRRLSTPFRLSLHLDSREVWPRREWVMSSELARVMMISTGPGLKARRVSIGPEEMARRLNILNRLEMKAYLELAQVFSFAMPDQGSAMMDAFASSEAELANGVANAECFLVQGPKMWVRRMAVQTALHTDRRASMGGID